MPIGSSVLRSIEEDQAQSVRRSIRALAVVLHGEDSGIALQSRVGLCDDSADDSRIPDHFETVNVKMVCGILLPVVELRQICAARPIRISPVRICGW